MLAPALVFKREFGGGDILLTPHGLAQQDWLISAVFILLFTDARAPEQVKLPSLSDDRRGYWGDAYVEGAEPNNSVGSLLWLLQREQVNQATLDQAIQLATDAIQPLVKSGHIQSVSVTGELIPVRSAIGLNVLCTLPDGREVPIAVPEVSNAVAA